MIVKPSPIFVFSLLLGVQAADAGGILKRPLSMSTRSPEAKEEPDTTQQLSQQRNYPGTTRAQSVGGSYQLNTGPHVQGVGGGSYTVGGMKLQRLSDGSYLFSDATHLKLLPDGSYSSSTGVLYRKLSDGSFAGTNGKVIRPTGDGSYNW